MITRLDVPLRLLLRLLKTWCCQLRCSLQPGCSTSNSSIAEHSKRQHIGS
jgi:hypothetical protein